LALDQIIVDVIYAREECLVFQQPARPLSKPFFKPRMFEGDLFVCVNLVSSNWFPQ
jgi:hypothetical protein